MLNPDDQKRVSFITSGGTYCYVVMPFGLKNAEATYQRLVDCMFQDKLGRNMEVYVDNMRVKSRQMDQHHAGLAETFDTLRKYHIKLNQTKCAFGVRSGKFLGYMVTERGIEVNPEQIRAIQEMKLPH
ncbi:UNVERIFIED_CONTAM: Retrovirus-related Pol polyprotein from transposon opus [Sesamum latifolium]|uniref:Retrovirus-related Pol polyprotein from transposon opus n=1 Tax=Sesamum latifolium TaxID=2727402 RepID=A0AAW2XPW9_9LAMI